MLARRLRQSKLGRPIDTRRAARTRDGVLIRYNPERYFGHVQKRYAYVSHELRPRTEV